MTEPVRFVTTVAIRRAVGGRETDILDAIGVPWKDGRRHINCPYRDHADDSASWRWDPKRAKAQCTCSKGDSIFDVVLKVLGCDFEAAKIRVAELLHRPDLIRTKGVAEGGGRRYQATDAASLLGALAECRDDTLPRAYLAQRLGVAMDAVPIPRTAMIGLKALSYYDPPLQGSKAKPKLVGEFPCAVFGTVAADGGTHAHRIYLAPAGAGKADLGIGPDGPREPKKSAKLVGDDNVAGRSVLWGDPGRAAHLLVAEGIETGAAVALAFVAEIKAGEVAVAAAISANGVEAFQPYLATKRVTVAGDRDEGSKANGKPGSRRGERAARIFGIRHHARLQIGIALPGDVGQSVDWLDVLVRDGIETVREGLMAAVAFVPTPAELEEVARDQGRAAELREIATNYPLPMMDTLTLVYRHAANGKVKVHKVIGSKTDPETGETEPQTIPIATPFGISARLRHIDQHNSYGLRAVVQDMNGKSRCIDFDRETLPRMGATEIRASLFAAGLRTEDDGEMIAVQCLKAADPEQEIIVVQRPGWHEISGCPDLIFISPGGHVIGTPDTLHLELAAAVRMTPDVAASGTMDGWRHAVEAAVACSGCEHWTLGTLSGFAGPLVALTGLDTCGMNLSGMTTSGKSTAQRLAASAWSTPDIRRPGLFQSARSTDNAVEALAQRADGTVLTLDELAHVGGKVVAKMIYTIAGGVGKKRMTADAQVRASYTWTTFAILSGESSLEEKVRGDGGEWQAGMAVRIIDIDVTGVNRNVDRATLGTIGQIDQHFGHAGPAFVQAMTEHGLHRQAGDLRDRVLKAARTLAGNDTTDSATIRAALPLAILMIAGELAKKFGVIPASTSVQGAVKWGWDRFRQSSDAAALDPEALVLGSIRGWIAERWDVTIKNVNVDGGINNRETIAWYDNDIVYIPKTRLREAAGSGVRESQVASILNRRGMLAKRTEADRFYVRYIPKVGRIESYALRRSEFGRSESASDTETFTVHAGGRDF
jgi:Domain of unknown function (DUF927)/Toprim domain